MGDGVKLPVIETVKLTVGWSVAILVKHWLLMVAFAVIPVLITMPLQFMILPDASIQPMRTVPPELNLVEILANCAFVLLFIFTFIIPALVTCNEIMHGIAGLNVATLGRYGGRIFGYILDCILVMLIALPVIFLAALIGGIGVAILGVDSVMGKIFGVLIFFVMFVLLTGCFTRFSLRLPSRAVGEVMPWKAVWALGRGNTLRLFGGQLLVFLILLLPTLPIFGLDVWLQGGMMVGKPPTMLQALAVSIASSLLIVVQTVFVNAFSALAYAYLRNARPDPIRAEPRF